MHWDIMHYRTLQPLRFHPILPVTNGLLYRFPASVAGVIEFAAQASNEVLVGISSQRQTVNPICMILTSKDGRIWRVPYNPSRGDPLLSSARGWVSPMAGMIYEYPSTRIPVFGTGAERIYGGHEIHRPKFLDGSSGHLLQQLRSTCDNLWHWH